MKPELFPLPSEGMVITHFLTVSDVKKSADFYKRILKAEIVLEGEPTIMRVVNAWLMVNVGGGPTVDKPDVTLSPQNDPQKASSFMSMFVEDIHKLYKEWSKAGAEFITEPKEQEFGWRCYMKDPDGYMIEIVQISPDFF